MKRLKISTDIETFLAEEKRYTDALTGGQVLRVKPENVGDAWLIRFLPVAFGSSSRWYVRTAKHWFKRSPITCPRHTGDDFGGSPDAQCPVCDLSAELKDEHNEEVSQVGFDVRANLAYTTFCLVYRIEKKHGVVREMSPEEILIPWECQLYKSTFEELCDYFRRGAKKARPLSVLDLERGNDFWLTKTNKGLRLDKDDPGPAFEEELERNADIVFDAIKEPRIKIPDLQQLKKFAKKVEAFAYGETSEPPERDSRRARRASGYDENEEEDEPRRGGRRRAAEEEDEPRRSSRRESRDEDEPRRRSRRSEEEDEPRRSSRRSEEEDEPRRGRSRREEDEDRDEPRRSRNRDEDPDEERPSRRRREEDEDRDEPRRGRSRREEDEDQVPGAEVPARRTGGSVSGGRKPVSARASSDVDENEDPGVTEEDKDQAPPKRSRPSDEGEEPEGEPEGEEPEKGRDPEEEAEERPSRRKSSAGAVGGRGSGDRGSRLKDRISRVARHG